MISRWPPSHNPPVFGADAPGYAEPGLGGVSEWFKVPLLKSGVGQPTVGSNPTPSATAGDEAEVEVLRANAAAGGRPRFQAL